jgi:hypothetical protein
MPWEDIPAPTALPPNIVSPETMPWEDILSATVPPSRPIKTNIPEPQVSGNDNLGDAVPFEQRLGQNLAALGAGAGAAQLSGNLVSMGAKLFENVPDLLEAGIKPQTLARMTPQGVNPADFAKTLQNDLNAEGAIGKTSKATFDSMLKNTTQAGEDVRTARDAIAQAAGPQAVTVNAQTALQPIYDAWGKEVNAIVPDSKTISTFGKYHEGLMKVAQNQGGQLSLDNIHDFLQEIGPKVNTGSEANQAIYSKLYGVGLDAQKGVVNTIAKQAGDNSLATNLLDANARYSRNMRLMPDVTMNTAKEAIKEGISAFQKYGGPTILKYGAAAAGVSGLEELTKKIYHVVTGGD